MDRFFVGYNAEKKLEWTSDFLTGCFSAHDLIFLSQTKNWTNHKMRVSFILAHTGLFFIGLFVLWKWQASHFCIMSLLFLDGLELAHTVQFFIAKKLSDRKVRFFIGPTVGALSAIHSFLVYDKNSVRVRLA